MEESVTFYSKNGKKLFGIVHVPELALQRGQNIGVNLLNPGIKYRVAPNRLNVILARELCRQGYFVLRFDPEGIGDSEGELPSGVMVADIWEKIQTGLFVQDTLVANNTFIDKYRIDDLTMIGNCGGAITSLLTAGMDSRVKRLCLIDVPVNLRAANLTFADKVAETGGRADWLFSEYVKRLLRLESWIRLFTLRTNYRALWKTLSLKINRIILRDKKAAGLPNNIERLCEEKRLNKLFFEAYEQTADRKQDVFFILAGNDPGTEIFQTYFQNGYLRNPDIASKNKGKIDIYVINKANHVYALDEWQELLISSISGWLKDREAIS